MNTLEFVPAGTPNSPYMYDVFLSYCRANDWPRFVDSIFVPMFRHWLEAEIGLKPKIFYDAESIEAGESWPYQLAEGIAVSKILVCLWSNEYFHSPWCMAELGHMLARRESTRSRSAPLPLILAVLIHDGNNIPSQLNDIQRFPIQDYANPWMRKDSVTAEGLSSQIRQFSVHVAHAIKRAPEFDPRWSGLAVDSFIRPRDHRVEQREVPSLGGFSS